MNSQETFSGGLNGWANAYGTAATSGAVTHLPSGGESGDGALQLERVNNNSNIGLNPAGINADVINFIKIKYQNNSNATSFRVQGSSGAGNLTNKVFSITANSTTWVTDYLAVGDITNWTGTLDNLDILVRASYSSGEGAIIIDEVEFLSLPSTFKGFVQNAGFDDFPTAVGFAPWDPATQAFATVNTSTDQFHNGTQSMKHEYSAAPGATHFVFNDYVHDFGASKTNQLKATLWVKVVRPSTPGTSPLISIQGQFRTGIVAGTLGTQSNNVTSTKTDGTWEQMSFSATPGTAYSFGQFRYGIRVLNLQADDIVYIDDISAFPTTIAATAGTWEAAGSWGGTSPAQEDAKTIDSNISINSAVVSSGPITISAANTLTITSGNSLTLNSDLTTNDGLILESGAQLIVTGNATGNATYNRMLTSTDDSAAANLEGWFTVTPPFSGDALDNAWADNAANSIATSGDALKRGLGTYTESSNTYSYLLADDSNASTFVAGKGYVVKRTTDGSISFTGTINTDDTGVDVMVTKTAGINTGFNLLGNPYPTNLNVATFITDNTTKLAQQQIWVWNDDGNTFNAKTGSSVLSPGQAFFIEANANTSVNISEAAQITTGGDTFQKTANTKLKLTISNDKTHRYAEIDYLATATIGYDAGYEGEVFNGIPDSFLLYTELLENNQGKNYQIQSLPNSGLESMVIPIGVKVAENAEFTFSLEANNIPSDLNVYLEDRVANTFTRLDELNSNYKVTLDAALDGTGRFFLHTKASKALSIDAEILNSVSIFKTSNNNLRVTGLKDGKASVSLYNLLGKQVLQTSFEASTSKDIALPNLATGVYLVNLQTAEGKISKKIILE